MSIDERNDHQMKQSITGTGRNAVDDAHAVLGPEGNLSEGEETLAAWDDWVEAMARRYSAVLARRRE